MTAYRTDERPTRVATIAIARPRSFWVGLVLGTVLLAAELGILVQFPRASKLTCTRDDAGHGSCEYTRRYVHRTIVKRWYVKHLRNAHVVTLEGKNEPVYRLVATFDEGDERILTSATAEEQAARAARINEFIANEAQHDLDLHEELGEGPVVIGLGFVLVGLGILIGSFIRFPAHRVVLDEGDRVARFARRSWGAWRSERSFPFAELSAIEAEIRTYKPTSERAIDEVRVFLNA
jgi:hypothetical protein